jgi:hypothetical protein
VIHTRRSPPMKGSAFLVPLMCKCELSILDIAASYYAFDGVSIVIIISILCLIGMAQQLAT